MRIFSDTFGGTCKRTNGHLLLNLHDGRRGFGMRRPLAFAGPTMGRLKAVAPRLGTVRARVRGLGGDRATLDRTRDQRTWRGWYKTARWQRLRWAVLVRDLFTCQWPGCGRIVGDTSKLVADHRRPHRGDETMFWDEANLWCLCKPCHDGAKARAEARGEA